MDKAAVAKLAYHGKIVGCTAALALVLAWLQDEKPMMEMALLFFCLLCTLVEIFLWMAPLLLRHKKTLTGKGVIKATLYKLAVFYVCVLLIAFLVSLAGLSVFYWLKGEEVATQLSRFLGPGFTNFLKYYVAGLSCSAIVYFYFLWKDTLGREQRLEREKLLFRLETLKSQVNPHFLFNSLNTLSSLVSMDAVLAEQFIQKLSSIYQYILGFSEAENVSLAAELDFVRDYFYLQQIRDGDKIRLSIQVDHPQQYKILPMSLQLLVENALKHNLATTGRPLTIAIASVDDGILVKNNLQRKSTLEKSKKIGLDNLRERTRFATGKDIKMTESREAFAVWVPLIG